MLADEGEPGGVHPMQHRAYSPLQVPPGGARRAELGHLGGVEGGTSGATRGEEGEEERGAGDVREGEGEGEEEVRMGPELNEEKGREKME